MNIYAVYPGYATGHEALIVMLKGSKYFRLTLRAAMIRYDGHNPLYIDTIVDLTGFDPERTVDSLTDKEFEMFWKAIEKTLDWQIGREDFIDKWYVSDVHKKRSIITEYLIAKSSGEMWTAKEEALKLAANRRLHAVIFHLKNGTIYLRFEYGAHRFELLLKCCCLWSPFALLASTAVTESINYPLINLGYMLLLKELTKHFSMSQM